MSTQKSFASQYQSPNSHNAQTRVAMLIASLDKLESDVFNHLYDLSPRTGVSLGLHEYDGKLPDVSQAKLRSWCGRAKTIIESIHALDKSTLDHEKRLDTLLLENMLERNVFDIERLNAYSSRPTIYTFQLSPIPYISRDYAPIDTRIRALNTHLTQIPRFLKQAHENLEQTLAKPIRDVTIAQAEGVVRDIQGQTTIEARKASPNVRNEFDSTCKSALSAIKSFVDDLRNHTTTSEFAVGKEKFEKIVWMNDRLKQPLEQILQLATDDLESNLAKLWEVAERIGKKLETVIDSISREHPTPENLVDETAKTLNELRQFIIDKDLISFPSDTKCRVVPTPALMRATTTAAMNSPGPFEKAGLEGLYYVTPVEQDWDEQRKDDWLRHLNYTTLKDISIHEVYPGHYTHRSFTTAFVKSRTKKSYWNTSFGEGWAHYAEEMMLDEGYGDRQLRFMQLKEALLRDCRFIVCFKMHTQGMSVEDAKTFIMENAFMSEQTAGREALRGTFDHSYYGYTLGKLMIKKARQQFFKAHPSAPIKSFHDKLLGLGSAPVGLLEDLIIS